MTPLDAQGISAVDAMDANVKLTAAIATHFDPMKVLGTESLLHDGRVDVIDGLAGVCEEVEVQGSAYPHWAMRPDARRHVLQTMAAGPDFTAQLDAVDIASDDSFARYLSDGLRGEDLNKFVSPSGEPSVVSSSVDLDGLLKAVRLLEDLPELPSISADLERNVRRHIALAESDKALQAVMPQPLIGRKREYDALVEYCSTPLNTDEKWIPSFVLVGPGGVGKSALVSTFVTHRRRQAGVPPVVYFDFDRAALIDAKPLDLTFELTRQLGLAEAALEQPLSEFRHRVRSLLGGQTNESVDIAGGTTSFGLHDLASQLSDWPRRLEPITLVLDTFEEVAILGVTAVRDVLEWVTELRDTARLEQLHVIICGREVEPNAPHLEPGEVAAMFNYHPRWELVDLAADDAVEMLIELGVNRELALRFPPVFGGNPLVLKLIHRFVQANDPVEVEKLLEEGEVARSAGLYGEVGLRFLYERILNRIQNPRVQALAYPGIVLRQVTPDLILKVLVPTSPVPIDVATDGDAQEAFQELASHVWLVNTIGQSTVEHRPDLRRLLVPGLERSSEINTAAIHRAAAGYFAAQPKSVAPEDARIEEIYHRGFLDDVAADMTESDADQIVRRLAGDLEYWPVHTRAKVKSLAERHSQLTEDEVESLDVEGQIRTRGARFDKSYASSDVGSADFEQHKIAELGYGHDASVGPESSWALRFARGDFEAMSESSEIHAVLDRFFIAEASTPWSLPSNPTHRHPWYIAFATLMANHKGRSLFSDAALAALELGTDSARRYAAAVAAIAGDRAAYGEIIMRVTGEIPRRLDITNTDDVLICQAAASRGDLDGHPASFQTSSCDHFRLSHLTAIATGSGDSALTELVTVTMDRYRAEQPDTADINHFRATLAHTPLRFGGLGALRAAPPTLSFLYGAVRTMLGQLNRTALLDVVQTLERRSEFWPSDLTADTLSTTLRTRSPSDLTALIEMADRCGLIVDLIDAASARVTTSLSLQLASGIRRIEGLLFPFADSSMKPPST